MFLLARTRHITRSNLKEEGVILPYRKGTHIIIVKKARRPGREVAGHMVFKLMMQRDLCRAECLLHNYVIM